MTEDQPGLDRSVILLLTSTFCASAAAAAQATALGKQVYDMTGRELDLGLLGLAEFAPAALLVLLTGSIADRFDRRRVAAIGVAGEAAAAGGLAWYAGTSPTAIGPIFILVLLFGVARAFVAPASRSLPPDVVGPERLPWLVPRNSASWQAAIIVGPVIGGVLLAVDERLPYLAVVTLLLISGAAILGVRVRPGGAAAGGAGSPSAVLTEAVSDPVAAAPHPLDAMGPDEAAATAARGGLHDALEGLRLIRHHPVLLGAISLDLFAVLFGGAIALLPAIATDRLGAGPAGLGWLRAAGGIGAAVVTIRLARRPVARRVGRTLLVAVAVFGLATIVLGATHTYLIAFVALAILSGADAISVFIRATLVPLVTPADKRGRVLAVENVFIGASNELGAFESGVAGQVLGPSGAIVLGGVATLAISASWWVLFPALRDVDRFPVSVDQ